MRKLILAISFSLLLVFLTGCAQETSDIFAPGGTPGVIKTGCFNLEESVAFDFQGVHYIRLFTRATIPAGKIGISALKVGTLPGGDEIYRYVESGNWQGQPMDKFLLIKLRDPEGFFDVYVDSSIKDSLPDFVKNCQPRGGNTVVMIPPPGSSQQEMPNSFFATAEINNAGHEKNYRQVESQLKKYYVKIGPTKKTEAATQIGTVQMKTSLETNDYDVFFHLEVIYLVNGDNVYQYDGTNDIPQVQNEAAKTLKLDTIRFVVLSEWNWFTPECKPVIYLYPEKETLLSLWLYPRGYLTLSEPEYRGGWENLWLAPSGKIFTGGKYYPYLHYEAMISNFFPPRSGFMVKKENLTALFGDLLPKMGLNPKEIRDFEDYWLTRLSGFPYFQVSPLSRKEIERIEPVRFSISPETFIRVRFYFKGFDQPIEINPPQIELPPARRGFTAVEWGGLYQD